MAAQHVPTVHAPLTQRQIVKVVRQIVTNMRRTPHNAKDDVTDEEGGQEDPEPIVRAHAKRHIEQDSAASKRRADTHRTNQRSWESDASAYRSDEEQGKDRGKRQGQKAKHVSAALTRKQAGFHYRFDKAQKRIEKINAADAERGARYLGSRPPGANV